MSDKCKPSFWIKPLEETPIDKSPSIGWVVCNNEFVWDYSEFIAEPGDIKVVEHSAYLAVKQELDESQLKLKRTEEQNQRLRVTSKLDQVVVLREQLSDAKAQIAELLENWKAADLVRMKQRKQIIDYEAALEQITKCELGEFMGKDFSLYAENIAEETLNKWRTK